MIVACLDLEGVLVPEVWLAVADKTGIEELRLTTREIPDYDELMKGRLKVLAEHGIKLSDIQEVISTLKPLEGAKEFLDWLRERFQVIILSDTYYEFMWPLMRQLDHPTLFCHDLVVENDSIVGYKLRQSNQKQKAVQALQSINFKCVATGDSYNDTTMLGQADAGALFKPSKQVANDFKQFPVANNYDELRAFFEKAAAKLS
ncbi:bifunctional phosphoserine phosphatase/homoserine phosphotransferase ThrH [Propionimicrobium sp. BV2F7]|uniref:bifunctional phosphoserine phosphatase/homoserine phosphotransferase ThrH n=1 Tax=Propionimicrobium sp. BV2F7 TaxID=1111131 RepID=UPI0003D79AB4|nr:bifunctional phosphoserine phosphatase/homoserine phosphotransferase ThrH [Propionimicrobium sp. BV2F7]ETJ97822.1 phosphoserine phosphatase/homoserine phosphotransferase bifunctional protein [Propionimicrobium sp. BV2F7]